MAGIFLGWLWWLCRHDSAIPFLPSAASLQWILYPTPPQATPHRKAVVSAVFRRAFILTAPTSTAKLSVRVFKSGALSLNGQRVPALALTGQDWKNLRTLDVSKLLRA